MHSFKRLLYFRNQHKMYFLYKYKLGKSFLTTLYLRCRDRDSLPPAAEATIEEIFCDGE